MTTQQNLIAGLQAVERMAQRVTSTVAADDWRIQAHNEENGFDRKQVNSHLTAPAEINPAFAGPVTQTPVPTRT